MENEKTRKAAPRSPGRPARLAYRAVRLLLAGVFLAAGLLKSASPKAFALSISAYGLIPFDWCLPAAFILIAVEILAGAGLAADIKGSLAAVTGLLGLFSAVLWFGALSGLSIDFGCFSAEEEAKHHDLWLAFYRDLALLTGAGFLYAWRAFYKKRRMI